MRNLNNLSAEKANSDSLKPDIIDKYEDLSQSQLKAEWKHARFRRFLSMGFMLSVPPISWGVFVALFGISTLMSFGALILGAAIGILSFSSHGGADREALVLEAKMEQIESSWGHWGQE